MRLLVIIFSLLFLVSMSFGQVWTWDSDFVVGSQPHDVLVGNDGKIWVGFYGTPDSLTLADTTYTLSSLRCYTADGNQTDFSPIMIFTNGTDINDTLFTSPTANNLRCRGLGEAKNGDIIYSCSNGWVYVINSQTGEALKKFPGPAYGDATGSLTNAAVDANGFLYIARVGGNQPANIYNAAYELYSVVADTVPGLQRGIEVSPDGNMVYFGKIYSGDNGVAIYKTDNALGPDDTYSPWDTVGNVAEGVVDQHKHITWGQCLDLDNNGLLWVGTYWDVAKYDFTGWYALDPTQDYAIVDTVGHNVLPAGGPFVVGTEAVGGTYFSPRHATWSVDGKTMYTADFDGGVIKKWTNADPVKPGATPLDPSGVVSVEYNDAGQPIIAVEFDLHQNYPNPFNPSTTIPFDLAKQFQVVLKIYDMTGQLVTTLVDKQLSAGHHEFKFEGTNLASGAYIYNLQINGNSLTKRMLLIK